MRGEIPYTATEYGNGSNAEAVALVTGLAGKTMDLERAARDLEAKGRDSVVYTYDPGVLLCGDAQLLPQCIDTISQDFARRTADYDVRRFAGVSLGGAIAANMQKHSLVTPERGLYAATGDSAAKLVMNNRLFGAIVRAVHHIDIRQVYARHGYTLEDLEHEWHDLQTPPITPFSVALGGMDVVMRERSIRQKLHSWQQYNADMHIIRRPLSGHGGTIRWFNTHIGVMLASEAPDMSLPMQQ